MWVVFIKQKSSDKLYLAYCLKKLTASELFKTVLLTRAMIIVWCTNI